MHKVNTATVVMNCTVARKLKCGNAYEVRIALLRNITSREATEYEMRLACRMRGYVSFKHHSNTSRIIPEWKESTYLQRRIKRTLVAVSE